MKIKAIITGATGMVGRSVLLECLRNDNVESILIINRRPTGLKHPKLKEILHGDFHDLSAIKHELSGYNACFFCMGVSSIGMNEEKYTKLTYDIVAEFVDCLYAINTEMVFNYVSGVGTDSSEKGRSMWAKVKGRTENYIFNKGFKDAYAIRLGMLIPEKEVEIPTFYKIIRPLFPLLRLSKSFVTSENIGKAMINSVLYPQELKYLTNRGMNTLAGK